MLSQIERDTKDDAELMMVSLISCRAGVQQERRSLASEVWVLRRSAVPTPVCSCGLGEETIRNLVADCSNWTRPGNASNIDTALPETPHRLGHILAADGARLSRRLKDCCPASALLRLVVYCGDVLIDRRIGISYIPTVCLHSRAFGFGDLLDYEGEARQNLYDLILEAIFSLARTHVATIGLVILAPCCSHKERI